MALLVGKKRRLGGSEVWFIFWRVINLSDPNALHDQKFGLETLISGNFE